MEFNFSIENFVYFFKFYDSLENKCARIFYHEKTFSIWTSFQEEGGFVYENFFEFITSYEFFKFWVHSQRSKRFSPSWTSSHRVNCDWTSFSKMIRNATRSMTSINDLISVDQKTQFLQDVKSHLIKFNKTARDISIIERISDV